MPSTDQHLPLDYTHDWIALGIVTTADIEHDQQECAASDDPHPEHYRWRAFSRFVSAQQSLSSLIARQLYALGAADSDEAMGSSIMAEVLRHRDCPIDLLQTALVSNHVHLKRIAAQRLGRNDRTT